MKLEAPDFQNLRPLIGQRVGRVFCPPASIFSSNIEADSFVIWLNNTADFLSVHAHEARDRGWLKVSRSNKPLYFPYDPELNGVSECSDVHLGGDFRIMSIRIFGEEKDYGLVFQSVAGEVFCILLDYCDLCLYRIIPGCSAVKLPRLMLKSE